MSLDLQIETRIESLRAEIKLLGGAEGTVGSATTDTHIRAICTQAETLLKGLNESLRERLRAVVRCEQLLRFARELKAQVVLQNADSLLMAGAVASECYQQAIRSVATLGIRPELERWPEPAVLLEPMSSPVTYVRDAATKPLGLLNDQDQPLPFPLVLLPWYPPEMLSALCLVSHEIGHNLDQDLRLTQDVLPALTSALERKGAKPEEIDVWRRWCREIVADAFGTWFSGVAFAVEIAQWGVALGDVNMRGPSHPFPSLRVALSLGLLRRQGVSGLSSNVQQACDVPAAEEAKPFEAQVDAVVSVLQDSPLACLAGASLADLAPAVCSEHRGVSATVAAQGDERLALLQRLPFRLFPSVASLATAEGQGQADVAKLLLNAAVGKAKGRSAVPFAQERYRQTTERAAIAPILDEEKDGLKVPPPRLFDRVNEVAFVGSVNDGLPNLFDAYAGPKKQRIEVFYLSPRALQGMSFKARTYPVNLAASEKSRAALGAGLLARVAEQFAIYEFDDPFLFGAYWDARYAGGRIHISAQGWGMDIKVAPSHDYVWPPSEPEPERTYRFYLDALTGLRARAKRLG